MVEPDDGPQQRKQEARTMFNPTAPPFTPSVIARHKEEVPPASAADTATVGVTAGQYNGDLLLHPQLFQNTSHFRDGCLGAGYILTSATTHSFLYPVTEAKMENSRLAFFHYAGDAAAGTFSNSDFVAAPNAPASLPTGQRTGSRPLSNRPLNPAWDKVAEAERAMARDDPYLWAHLAKADLKALMRQHPDGIPTDVWDAHTAKFSDAYGLATIGMLEGELAHLTIKVTVTGDSSLPVVAKAEADVFNEATPMAPTAQRVVGAFSSSGTSDFTRHSVSSANTNETFTPTTNAGHAAALASKVKSYSPGPDFPPINPDKPGRLGRRSANASTNPLVPACTPKAANSTPQQRNKRLTGVNQAQDFQTPFSGGPVQYKNWVPEHTTRHRERRQSSYTTPHRHVNHILPEDALMQIGRGSHGRPKWPARTDRGPGPSAADKYPEDMEISLGTHPNANNQPVLQFGEEGLEPPPGIIRLAATNPFETMTRQANQQTLLPVQPPLPLLQPRSDFVDDLADWLKARGADESAECVALEAREDINSASLPDNTDLRIRAFQTFTFQNPTIPKNSDCPLAELGCPLPGVPAFDAVIHRIISRGDADPSASMDTNHETNPYEARYRFSSELGGGLGLGKSWALS